MSKVSRRSFFGAVGAAVPALGAEADRVLAGGAGGGDVGPLSLPERRAQAFDRRVQAAQFQKDLPLPDQTNNGDERLYPDRIGNFSKGLPHNRLGEVEPSAYNQFLQALSSGRPSDFENLPMGSPDPSRQLKLVNPQSGLAFETEGADSHHLAMPAAPRLGSAETAGEAVELYWQALARDVPFTDYGTSPLAQAAATDLARLSAFRGPLVNGRVTPAVLFRCFTPGDITGPYVSQFLLRPIPFGSQWIDQRMRTVVSGVDYLTSYQDWLSLQNGVAPPNSDRWDMTRRYIRNGRDLATWVHRDVLFQAYFNANLILMTPADATDEITGGGLGAPLNPTNPYNASRNQAGFGTLGPPYFSSLVAEVGTRALKAVWYQKWFVHRRLRPEAYGGRIHNLVTGQRPDYPLNGEVLSSAALSEVFSRNGSYLLPQAFTEGCPLHPAYGAGHATVAGAAVTILKALFDESYAIPNPVVPSPDGLSLVPYTGPDAGQLTVGGELNKLAANIAIGRNFAGIHWRSDYANSLRLGEAVATCVLQDQARTFNEDFGGFAFTGFDGTRVVIA